MSVIPCKIHTKHDRIRLINIDFENLHKSLEILVYRNLVHQFVHGARKLGCYLMDYNTIICILINHPTIKNLVISINCNLYDIVFVISYPFLPVLLTSLSVVTEKVMYFPVFSPKQLNCP